MKHTRTGNEFLDSSGCLAFISVSHTNKS